MKFEKQDNTLKDFCSSGKFHIPLVFLLSSALAYMITKNNPTDFFDVFVSLVIILFVVYLILMALYITRSFNKGLEKQRKGDYQKAIKYYNSVIRIHRNNRFILPALKLILGIDPETDLKAPTEIPTKIPDGRVSQTHKDNILFVQKFPYTYELEEYILRNTNIFTATYYNKGNSNAALKNHEKAIEAFDKAIEICWDYMHGVLDFQASSL